MIQIYHCSGKASALISSEIRAGAFLVFCERSNYMRMKEFTEKLANEVEARLNGVQVTPTKNWKNNSVVL